MNAKTIDVYLCLFLFYFFLPKNCRSAITKNETHTSLVVREYTVIYFCKKFYLEYCKSYISFRLDK